MLSLLIGAILSIFLWYRIVSRRRLNKPPGPFPFPFVGNLPQIATASSTSYIALEKLSKRYGQIMSIQMGFIDTVFVSSYEIFKDLWTREETLGRHVEGIFWDRNLKKNIGLGFSNGEAWSEMRKFCFQSLRQYGFGSRQAMENLIMDELIHLVNHLEKDRQSHPNGLVRFTTNYFNMSLTNLMSSMVMGKRLDYDDPDLRKFLYHAHRFSKNGIFGTGMLAAFPFLKYIFPNALGYNIQMEATFGIMECAQNLLNRRREEDYANNPRCFADDFLSKIDEDKSKPEPFYTDENFMVVYGDVMQGGSDTTANAINFIILLLAAHPNCQKKLYSEIELVSGIERFPNLEDKLIMPYAQAVVLEGLRWARILVFALPRKVTTDFEYKGFKFRKDAVLMVNIHTLFFDETFWGDPLVFRPERFLDTSGKLLHSKAERIVPFSAGKRNCFGEVLAKDSTFLFITTLIQKFQFALDPNTYTSLEPMMGITLGPHEYQAFVTVRNPI